jgi:glycine/D-amino acid oxidase-like deaminating enzyme
MNRVREAADRAGVVREGHLLPGPVAEGVREVGKAGNRWMDGLECHKVVLCSGGWTKVVLLCSGYGEHG